MAQEGTTKKKKLLPDDAPLEVILSVLVGRARQLMYYRQCLTRYSATEARSMLEDFRRETEAAPPDDYSMVVNDSLWGLGAEARQALLSSATFVFDEDRALGPSLRAPNNESFAAPPSLGQQLADVGSQSYEDGLLIPSSSKPPGTQSTYESTLEAGLKPFGAGGEEYFRKLAVLQAAFEDKSDCGRYTGMKVEFFLEFVAPILTNSVDEEINDTLVCQLDNDANGFITFDDFSNYFLLRQRVKSLDVVPYNIVGATATGTRHHSMITKVLFSNSRPYSPSLNTSVDRYCFTGGYDGAVRMWDTGNYLDHVRRVHYIPDALKQKQWVNDMCFSTGGRLCVAQSYGYLYMYNVHPQASSLHRILRAGNEESAGRAAMALQGIGVSQRRGVGGLATPGSGVVRRRNLLPEEIECVLQGVDGDILCVDAPQHRLGGGGTGLLSHVSAGSGATSNAAGHEPLLMGTDDGLVYLFNLWKPVDLVSHITPIVTWRHYGDDGRVNQILTDALDNIVVTVGCDAHENYAVQFIDYEKGVPSIRLNTSAKHQHRGKSPTLKQIDYDAKHTILVASGPSRQSFVFTSSFPEPIATLRHHGESPVVSSMLRLATYSVVTVTEDKTFHLWDSRMWRKVQVIPDREQRWPENKYSAAGFDFSSNCAVAAASSPVMLKDVSGGGVADQQKEKVRRGGAVGGSPSKKGKRESFLAYHQAYTVNPVLNLFHAVEGDYMKSWALAVPAKPPPLSAGSSPNATFNESSLRDSQLPGRSFGMTRSFRAPDNEAEEASVDFCPPSQVGDAVDVGHGVVGMSVDTAGRRLALVLDPGTSLSIRSATSGEELSFYKMPVPRPESNAAGGIRAPGGTLSRAEEISCISFVVHSANSMVIVGTLQGNLHVLKEEALRLIEAETYTIQAAVPITHIVQASGLGKVLIGTAAGLLVQLGLETGIISTVLRGVPTTSAAAANAVPTLSFATGAVAQQTPRARSISPHLDLSEDHPTGPTTDQHIADPRSVTPSAVSVLTAAFAGTHLKRKGKRHADLHEFQSMAYEKMDRAIEDIKHLDLGYVAVLYGKGTVVILHVTKAETAMAFYFPVCDTSACALGFHRGTSTLAVSDFQGRLYLFSAREYFTSMKVGKPLQEVSEEGAFNGFALQSVTTIDQDILISSIKGLVDKDRHGQHHLFALCCPEQETVLLLDTQGTIQYRMGNPRMAPNPSVLYRATPPDDTTVNVPIPGMGGGQDSFSRSDSVLPTDDETMYGLSCTKADPISFTCPFLTFIEQRRAIKSAALHGGQAQLLTPSGKVGPPLSSPLAVATSPYAPGLRTPKQQANDTGTSPGPAISSHLHPAGTPLNVSMGLPTPRQIELSFDGTISEATMTQVPRRPMWRGRTAGAPKFRLETGGILRPDSSPYTTPRGSARQKPVPAPPSVDNSEQIRPSSARVQRLTRRPETARVATTEEEEGRLKKESVDEERQVPHTARPLGRGGEKSSTGTGSYVLATQVKKDLEDDDGTTRIKQRKTIPRLLVKAPDQPVKVGALTYQRPVPTVANTMNRNLHLAMPPQWSNPLPRVETPDFEDRSVPASATLLIDEKINQAVDNSAHIAERIDTLLRRRKQATRESMSQSGSQVFRALDTKPVTKMGTMAERVRKVKGQPRYRAL